MSRSNQTLGLIMLTMIAIVIPLKLSAQAEGMAAMMAVDGYVVLSNGDTLQINSAMFTYHLLRRGIGEIGTCE
jgi:phage FluMu protein gp41